METLTEAEAALYDRQIRLWGLEAQRQLRASRILMIGMSHGAQEIAKNIILAGVASVDLVDDVPVGQSDVHASFVLEEHHLGQNRASASVGYLQDLNPLVKVSAVSLGNPASVQAWVSSELKPDAYEVILYCPDHWTEGVEGFGTLDLLSRKVRNLEPHQQPKVFTVFVVGHHFFTLVDLGPEFSYVQPKRAAEPMNQSAANATNVSSESHEKQMVKFCPISKVLLKENSSLIPRHMRKFFVLDLVLLQFFAAHGGLPTGSHLPLLQEEVANVLQEMPGWPSPTEDDMKSCCAASFAPINAIAGGIIAQEVIKAISQNDCPLGNYIFFDALRHDAYGHFISPTASE